MVTLLPGVSVDDAVGRFRDAVRELGNVRGGSITELDSLNKFRAWAAIHARVLASVLSPASVDELVLTTGYDRLVLLSPAAYGNGLRTLVDIEVDAVERRLNEAAASLGRQQKRWEDWRAGKRLQVVVVDTNVLLRHADRLPAVNWRESLLVDPDDSVTLAVPLAVVQELDGLKTSNNKMEVDGKDETVRSRVRIVHKQFDEWFAGSRTESLLHEPTAENPHLGELRIKVMVDDLRHVRLPTADAEIIDRALALTPFAAGVALATNDRAMRIQARFEGLHAYDPQLFEASTAS